ncbi:hypothetical protein D3C83_152040 [compost metagenome]
MLARQFPGERMFARARTDDEDLHGIRLTDCKDRRLQMSRNGVHAEAAKPDYFVDVAACCALESAAPVIA